MAQFTMPDLSRRSSSCPPPSQLRDLAIGIGMISVFSTRAAFRFALTAEIGRMSLENGLPIAAEPGHGAPSISALTPDSRFKLDSAWSPVSKIAAVIRD